MPTAEQDSTNGPPSPGRLIFVVGPSGAGKDSVINGALAQIHASGKVSRLQRVITRPPDLGGEDYHSVSTDTFKSMEADGAFALTWFANGLHYGLPAKVLTDLEHGNTIIANGSRAALPNAREVFPSMMAVLITSSPATLAMRLSRRGREDAAAIEQRLSRNAGLNDTSLIDIVIENNGPLDQAVSQFIDGTGLSNQVAPTN